MSILAVDAVVVTYCPNLTLLDSLILSLKDQVRYIYIIDNGSRISEGQFDNIDNLILVELDENKGIACAQNVGIRMALNNNADYVLLSDQDTIYPKEYVHEMLDVSSCHPEAGAYAPLISDYNKNGFIEKVMVSGLVGYKKISPNNKCHNLYHAISSGLILNLQYIKEIGLMNEDLFIDWVDFEWCWRSRSKGHPILGVSSVKIEHRLGDCSINIGYRNVNLRNVSRNYYITRNAFYLATRTPYLSAMDKVFLFFRSLRYVLGYPLFSNHKRLNLKYTIIGLYHGLVGRLGKYEVKS